MRLARSIEDKPGNPERRQQERENSEDHGDAIMVWLVQRHRLARPSASAAKVEIAVRRASDR